MDILEKVARSGRMYQFTLYREGDFYRCYDADAMLFTMWVEHSAWSMKYEKSMGTEVMMAELPVAEVENGNFSFEHIKRALASREWECNGDHVVFLLKKNLKQDYDVYWAAITGK